MNSHPSFCGSGLIVFFNAEDLSLDIGDAGAQVGVEHRHDSPQLGRGQGQHQQVADLLVQGFEVLELRTEVGVLRQELANDFGFHVFDLRFIGRAVVIRLFILHSQSHSEFLADLLALVFERFDLPCQPRRLLSNPTLEGQAHLTDWTASGSKLVTLTYCSEVA